MVDVSYGGDGPTLPLPLPSPNNDHDDAASSPPIITPGIGTASLRLIRAPIPAAQTTTSHGQQQKLWTYQYRNADHMDWNSCYCFPELEFTPADFEVMNFYASQSPASFQTRTVLVIKFLRRQQEEEEEDEGDEEEEEEGGKPRKEKKKRNQIYGKVMMVDGVVKRNLGGKTEIVRICRSEEERMEALGGFFGIRLTEEEREGIKGREVELGKGDSAAGKNSWL